MRTRTPPATPIHVRSTPASAHRRSTSASSPDRTLTTIHDGVSSNTAAMSPAPSTSTPHSEKLPSRRHTWRARRQQRRELPARHRRRQGRERRRPSRRALGGRASWDRCTRAAPRARGVGHAGGRASCSTTPSIPTTGVGAMSSPAVSLYRLTLPPTTGTSSARQASLMPSIASESCHITAGCSGFPKFRQFTSREWASTDAREIGGRFGDDHRGAEPRVVCAPPMVAVGREREPAAGVCAGGRMLQPQDCRISTGPLHRVEEQLVVVLRPDPGRVGEVCEQVLLGVVDRHCGTAGPRRRPCLHGAVVQRSGVVERCRRHVREHRASEAVEDAQPAAIGDSTDHGRTNLPPRADAHDRRETLRLDDRQHPLLTLACHDLGRLHLPLATGHGADVDVHSDPTTARQSQRSRRSGLRRRDPGCRRPGRRRAARDTPR